MAKSAGSQSVDTEYLLHEIRSPKSKWHYNDNDAYSWNRRLAPSRNPTDLTSHDEGSSIVVSECEDAKISNIIKGVYRHNMKEPEHHCKPVYSKEAPAWCVPAFIYFWDNRNGKELNGWWIGPALAAETVWAYNEDVAALQPPQKGWKIPWNGSVDKKLKLTYTSNAGGSVACKDTNNHQRRGKDNEEGCRETIAAKAIRVALQKMIEASPSDFPTVKREFALIRAQNFDELGSQEEVIMREVEETARTAQERIARLLAQQEAETIKRKQVQAMIEEDNKQKQGLLKVLSQSNTDIETVLDQTRMILKTRIDMANSDLDDIVSARKDAEHIEKHMRAMKDETIRWLENIVSDTDCNAELINQQPQSYALQQMLVSARETLDQNVIALTEAGEKARRRGDALRIQENRIDLFKQFDGNAKGSLSKEEVRKYSASEHDFHLQDEVLNKIMHSLQPINVANFRMLHVKIAIAKLETLARQKKDEDLKREQTLQARKRKLEVEERVADERIAAVEKMLCEAKHKLQPVCCPTEANMVTSTDMKTIIAEVQKLLEKSQEGFRMGMQTTEAIEESITALVEEEVAVNTAPIRALQKRLRLIQQTENHVTSTMQIANATIQKKISEDIRRLVHDSVKVIHAYMVNEKKTTFEIIEHLAGEAEFIRKNVYVEFIKNLVTSIETPCSSFNLVDEQAEMMYTYLSDEKSQLPKERMLDLIRKFYKCHNRTILSQDMEAKSKKVRWLSEGETVECLLGPVNASGLARIKCLAIADGKIGWVTITSSGGTHLLLPGGDQFRCIRPTALGDKLCITENKNIRRIFQAETGRVLQFPTTDPNTQIERIRGRMDQDDQVGWITVYGNQGTQFIEIL